MITFINKGKIDLEAISTFGVSSKENDNAIGYFGTGLKYAIAILIRHGCDIELRTNGVIYKFGFVRKKIRMNEFDFITMNEEVLPFTTELGKNWDLWQAMREIYSNCLDEGGYVVDGHYASYSDDYTYIVVDGDQFKKVWRNKNEVFLESTPIFKDSKIEIHDGESNYVYYKGIRVHELSRPSMYTYNILTNISLTEDRTMASSFDAEYYPRVFIESYAADDISEIIKKVVTATDYYFESRFTYSSGISDQFKNIVNSLHSKFTKNLNQSAIRVCKKSVIELIKESCVTEISIKDKELINKAAYLCEKLDFDVFEYKINVTEFLGNGVMGAAIDNQIFITRLSLLQGVDVVASTLLEEYIHLKYNLSDETRELESFLFNLNIQQAKKIAA